VTRRGARTPGATERPAVADAPDLFGESAPTPGKRSSRSRAARQASADDVGETSSTAISVSSLTEAAKDLIEGAVPALWVRGEVSDFKRHRNGHWYFTLRDARALLRCVVWGTHQLRIPAPPDDGMEVTAFGRLTIWPTRGDLQFSVVALEATGDGLWRKALEAARARLEREGLLAPERRRVLPRHPTRVEVVTSASGAAVHDIVSVIHRRCSLVEVVVIETRVQGDGAPREIAAAIDRVGRWGECDTVIVGRGGGAREDLWAFNDERVARAVARCPIPVISAVGHEIDTTLCDLVADHRASTPSAAAEAAVPLLADVRSELSALAEALRTSGRALLNSERARAMRLAADLAARGERMTNRHRSRLDLMGTRLHALSPLATLERGFAVASDAKGRTLSSSAEFAAGMSFTLTLRDGSVAASVDDVTRLSSNKPSTP